MRKSTIAAMALSGALTALPVATGAQELPERSWNLFDEVRLASSAYHSLDAAIADGFVPFDVDGGEEATCFESETGGMGVHYVRGIDEHVSVADPEAMVYELTPGGTTRLVAVEYIVPEEFVEDDADNVVALPRLFGVPFHKHSSLPVYVLHAWVWQENPAGIFTDYNPLLGPCPAT